MRLTAKQLRRIIREEVAGQTGQIRSIPDVQRRVAPLTLYPVLDMGEIEDLSSSVVANPEAAAAVTQFVQDIYQSIEPSFPGVYDVNSTFYVKSSAGLINPGRRTKAIMAGLKTTLREFGITDPEDVYAVYDTFFFGTYSV